MTPATATQCLIIGVGNAYRRDDGVGLFVTRRLRECGVGDFTVIENGGEATDLMEAWHGAEVVILVDAVNSGARPGTIHRFDAVRQPLPTHLFSCSSHAFGVPQAVELARSLDRLPRRLTIWGIEGERFDAGIGLSLRTQQAGLKLTRQLRSDRAAWRPNTR